jgi:DNA polymerase-3 subunit gamma/tau
LFKKLSKTTILEKIAGMAKAEKIKIDTDALELIAAAADGSARDAESLLDQLSSYETKIDLATAERLTGRIGFQTVDRLAEMIMQNDLNRALEYTAKMNEEGVNVVQLTRDLIHYLRGIVTLKLNPPLESAFHADLTGEEVKRLKALAELAKPLEQLKLIKALIRAYAEIRYSPFASVPLEIALIEHMRPPS